MNIVFRIYDKIRQEEHEIDLLELAEGPSIWFDGETDMWEVFHDAITDQSRFVIKRHETAGWEDYKKDKNREKSIISLKQYLKSYGFSLYDENNNIKRTGDFLEELSKNLQSKTNQQEYKTYLNVIVKMILEY